MCRVFSFLQAIGLLFLLQACSFEPSLKKELSLTQEQVLKAQALRLSKVEVLFAARVYRLLPDDFKGLPHEKFLLRLNNGSSVLVAHDTKYAPYVPVSPGDLVNIKGEYVWNAKGGLVHWTHKSQTPKHESGYIEWRGKRYE